MTRARGLALAAAVALLPGCGLAPGVGSTATETVTVSSSDSPSTSSTAASSAADDDPGTVTGAGRVMDEGGLRAALPSAGDLGSGWVDDEVATVFETRADEVEPSSCAALIQKGPGWDEVRRTEKARVEANFRRADNPAPPGTRRHLGMWLYSFGDPYPTGLFDEAGARVSDCSSFEVKQTDTGNWTTYEATPLTFPTLGDRTIAYRLTARQTYETLWMDYVVVKVGHNTVSVANAAYGTTPDTEVTESAARAAVDGLEP